MCFCLIFIYCIGKFIHHISFESGEDGLNALIHASHRQLNAAVEDLVTPSGKWNYCTLSSPYV